MRFPWFAALTIALGLATAVEAFGQSSMPPNVPIVEPKVAQKMPGIPSGRIIHKKQSNSESRVSYGSVLSSVQTARPKTWR
jgi:hypothetical protein